MEKFKHRHLRRSLLTTTLAIFLSLFLFLPVISGAASDLPWISYLSITEAQSDAAGLDIHLAANSVYTLEVLYENIQGGLKIRDSGTAILLDENGYFISLSSTLNSACEPNYKLKPRSRIRLSNILTGKEYNCTVLGRDFETDLALLKAELPEEEKLNYSLNLDNSRPVNLGEKLLHFGANNPFKSLNSVNFGHVVALKAPQVTESGLSYLLFESEAMISKTELFGPAFGMDGKLLGFSIYKKDRLSSDRNSYFYTSDSLSLALARLLNRSFKELGEDDEIPEKLEHLLNFEKSLEWNPLAESTREAEEEELNSSEKKVDLGDSEKAAEEDQEASEDEQEPQDYKIFLGLSFYCDDYYQRLREKYELPAGLMLAEVNQQGPAYIAGLNEREIIIEANQKKIESFQDFYEVTVALNSGEALNLKLSCEDGSVKESKVYVKKAPGSH